MPEPDAADATASWGQLEQSIERLHAAARAGVDAREFYRQLLAECATTTGASGGAAWRLRPDGRLELIYEVRTKEPAEDKERARARLVSSHEAGSRPGSAGALPAPALAHRHLVENVINRGVADVITSPSAAEDAPSCVLVQPVVDAVGSSATAGTGTRRLAAAIELRFAAAASPLVQQGWLDFTATIASIAADFHAFDDLERLRETAGLHRQAVALLRRVQAPRDLAGVAFEIANEGRRILACDRVSVLLRRSRTWRLISASGVTQIQPGGDFTRDVQRLAEQVAHWGEPVDYPSSAGAGDRAEVNHELPPSVASALEQHLDRSQARELIAVPFAFDSPDPDHSADRRGSTSRRSAHRFDAVLIAERFQSGDDAWRTELVELAELCAPTLSRALTLDQFPIRTALHWSDRLAGLTQPSQRVRTLVIVGAIVAVLAALRFIPADFDVEAPATLRAAVERDVFATATGAVAEVRVQHGQLVRQDDVLVVLDDPELVLRRERIRGELDTARKRWEALAVSRTDRTLRDNPGEDRLPLSAEQRQLEQRLASLESQAKLLESRHDALTIRSPLAGQVLTRDVQSLLTSRPVERGQALLTIADASSGWEVVADVPQRHAGHVIAARAESKTPLRASVRLAGDVAESYDGAVLKVAAVAPLDAHGLYDPAPPVPVRIALSGAPPPAARPGMTAAVRIHCGERSLGYVWLYDVAATLYRWINF